MSRDVDRLLDQMDQLGERALARALARFVYEERKELDRQAQLRQVAAGQKPRGRR